MSQQKDTSKAQRIWDLLSELYTNNLNLSQLSEDKRKFHAAELVVAAWRARQNQSSFSLKPAFVNELERRLTACKTSTVQTSSASIPAQEVEQLPGPNTPESFFAEQDLNAILGLDLPDIDWAFWGNME